MGLIIPEKKRVGMLDDVPDEAFGGDRETRDSHDPFVPHGAPDETPRSRGVLLEEDTTPEENEPAEVPPGQPTLPQRPAYDKETIRVSPVETTREDLEPFDDDAPEDELGDEEEETEESRQKRLTDESLAEVNMPEDVPGTGAPRDVWIRKEVFDVGGKPFSDALEIIIDGIPTAISIIVDFTPVAGDLKGIVEAIRGRDLITDQELGWGCRFLSLLCLSELRVVVKGGKSTRTVGKIEANIPVDRLVASGADKNIQEAFEKSLKKAPEIRQAIQEDAKAARFKESQIHGAKVEDAMERPVAENAKRVGGKYERQVPRSKPGVRARLDYLVTAQKFRIIYEIKGMRWGMPSYATRSGVSSLLSKIGAQVRRHLHFRRDQDIYEMVFHEMPLHDWQKEMILKWADELGIIVSFERPRGL